MEGGCVTKERSVNKDNGRPISTFWLCHKQETAWIYGGSYPGWKCIIDYLKSRDVKVIVTFTLCPLTTGRNINHLPFQHEKTEWIDSDLEESDLAHFELVHIPVADRGYLTPENAAKLLEVARRCKEGDINTYFHCWAGEGRCCMAVVYILMKLYNMSYSEVNSTLCIMCRNMRISDPQHRFLNDKMWKSDIKEYLPVIKTPPDHACYKI